MTFAGAQRTSQKIIRNTLFKILRKNKFKYTMFVKYFYKMQYIKTDKPLNYI